LRTKTVVIVDKVEVFMVSGRNCLNTLQEICHLLTFAKYHNTWKICHRSLFMTPS
jgi:hypothetical protein